MVSLVITPVLGDHGIQVTTTSFNGSAAQVSKVQQLAASATATATAHSSQRMQQRILQRIEGQRATS
jgi:hypothetical protein